MYSVEAEFIDRVVAQYGPCESRQTPFESHILFMPKPSYKSGRHRLWTDLCKSSRKGRI